MDNVSNLEKLILEKMKENPQMYIETSSTVRIDNDLRTIHIPSEIKILGVESDDDVNRIYFKMPRTYGEFDLSDFDIRVNYLNGSDEKNADLYAVEDKKVEDNFITFSWLVGRNAVKESGDTRFVVCLRKSDSNGVVVKEFNTTVATLPVLEGLETSDKAVQNNPDIIEQILKKLDDTLGIPEEQIRDVVQEYLETHPLEEKDPTVPEWAKKPTKPTYTSEEVGALPKETKIPSKLSDMEADGTHRTVTDEEKDSWNAKSDFSGKYADLQEKPSAFPPSEHKHTKSEITDFAHGHSWNEIEDKPTIPQVPGKLPNPYKLVMTGAVEAEYDGTKEVTVNIPQGGDGGSDFSGSYNDLTDKPVIPSKLSELAEDAENRTVSDSEKEQWNAKSEFNGDYNSLTNKPTIPTSLSALKNDTGFVNKAGVESEVSKHNTGAESHSDIRLLITNLTSRLNALADSDDQSLDQLSEIVAYIKSNKALIDSITTSKVGVSDIINNLTTNIANKPLSAAQGVALKALIDAIVVPTLLSQLKEDATHRTVTDSEKSTWNNKSNFSGNYNDLTNKPTLITEDRVIQLIDGRMPASAEGRYF